MRISRNGKDIRGEIRDGAGISGHVRIYVNKRLWWEGSNLVVNGGLNYCATLLSGLAAIINPSANPTVSYETVDTIRLGNGGSVNLVSDPTVPVPPQRTDTALIAEILPSALAPDYYSQNAAATPSSNTVSFTYAFQSDILVDGDFPLTDGSVVPQSLFVNEAGLYVNAPTGIPGSPTIAPTLFARVTFPSIAFAPTSGTTLTIEWIVGFL
jgi:hypothetical protein